MNKANWPIGYTWAAGWEGGDFDRFASLLASAGCNLAGIEAIDWFKVQPCDCKKTGGSSRYGGCNNKGNWKEAQRFVASMARAGLTSVITYENRNSCACRRLSEEKRRARYLNKALKLANYGPIWMIPTSEPWVQESGMEAFVRWARSVTPAHVPFVLPDRARNSASGVPYWSGIDHFIRDVHPCSMEAAIKAAQAGPRTLVNTDCTGTLDPGPSNALRLARETARTKAGLLIYRFEGMPREDTIAALGQGIHEAVA